MSGYIILGTPNLLASQPDPLLTQPIPSVLGGAVGLVAGAAFAHPVLGLLLGAAVGRSADRVLCGEESPSEASTRLRRQPAATLGALALPIAPVGYALGLLADRAVFGAPTGRASLTEVRAGKGTISRGAKGSAVEYVQAVVGAVADGDFGPKTEKAVVAFQVIRSLPATGIVDQRTLAAIDQLAGSPSIEVKAKAEAPVARAPASRPPAEVKPTAATSAAVTLEPLPATSSATAVVRDKANQFLAFLKDPLYPNAPVARWQAGLLGLGGVALLGAGVYLLRTPTEVPA